MNPCPGRSNRVRTLKLHNWARSTSRLSSSFPSLSSSAWWSDWNFSAQICRNTAPANTRPSEYIVTRSGYVCAPFEIQKLCAFKDLIHKNSRYSRNSMPRTNPAISEIICWAFRNQLRLYSLLAIRTFYMTTCKKIFLFKSVSWKRVKWPKHRKLEKLLILHLASYSIRHNKIIWLD